MMPIKHDRGSPQLTRKPNRAAALFFVLVITAVFAVLMVAFLVINRQQMALSGNTLARQASYDACISGLNFVQSQLEADRTWGCTSFPLGNSTLGYPAGAPLMTVTTFGDGLAVAAPTPPNPANNYISGRIATPSGIEATFKANVVNNLYLTNTTLVTPLGDVPRHAIRVRIEAQSSGMTRRLDVVLRKHAFSDSILASGADTSVLLGATPGQGWNLLSRDYANLVRANGNIWAPKPTDSDLQFVNTTGNLKAAKEITLKDLAVSTATSSQLAAQQTAANGLFQPYSKPVVVPELKGDQLRLPATHIAIPAGSYTMTSCVREDAGINNGDGTYTVKVTSQMGMETPAQLMAGPATAVNVIRTTPGANGWVAGRAPDITGTDNTPTIFSATVNGTAKNVVADLSTGDIYIPSGLTLKAQGDIDFKPGNTGINATLNFGFEYTGVKKTPFNTPFMALTPSTAIEQMGSDGAAVSAINGSIHISGMALGLGSISADRDITLSAQPGMSSRPSVAVAVRAGNDLTLNPPPRAKSQIGLKVDGPVFNSAMNSTGNWPALENYVIAYFGDTAPTTPTTNVTVQNVTDASSKPLTGAAAWDLMAKEVGKAKGAYSSGSVPGDIASTSFPFNKQLCLEDYVRLREYMRSGNKKWLDRGDADYKLLLTQLLDSQLCAYSSFARATGVSLQTLMAMGGVLPDMYFVGLVYAGRNLTVSGSNNSMYAEGAMVAKGNIALKDVPDLTTVYNRLFLEDITKPLAGQTKLEPVYFNLQ